MGGGPGANVLGGHCRCIRFIRFGRGSESNESNESKKGHPGLSIQTPPPKSGASESDESNGSTASQVLALGPTLDALDALASGQALTLMSLLNLKSWP